MIQFCFVFYKVSGVYCVQYHLPGSELFNQPVCISSQTEKLDMDPYHMTRIQPHCSTLFENLTDDTIALLYVTKFSTISLYSVFDFTLYAT